MWGSPTRMSGLREQLLWPALQTEFLINWTRLWIFFQNRLVLSRFFYMPVKLSCCWVNRVRVEWLQVLVPKGKRTRNNWHPFVMVCAYRTSTQNGWMYHALHSWGIWASKNLIAVNLIRVGICSATHFCCIPSAAKHETLTHADTKIFSACHRVTRVPGSTVLTCPSWVGVEGWAVKKTIELLMNNKAVPRE